MMNHPQSPPEVVSQLASCVQQLEVDEVAGIALAPVIQLLKVDPLPVGSQHEVYVSHVIDGAQSFKIQLKENRLQKLMELMNAPSIHYELVELCYDGLVCLGRYSEIGQLARALVTKVLNDGAILLFVDYGNTETVTFSKIYKLPAQFLEEPIMALQFTLAGVSTSPAFLTQKVREMFKELVEGTDRLLLCVSEPEIQGKQYCELYICDEEGAEINIRQKILDEMKLVKPALHDRLIFKRNSTNNVIVTHIESPIRFFVRLKVDESPFEALVDSFADYCKNSPVKNIVSIEEVHDNMAVWFEFRSSDYRSRWGRGLVVGEPLDDGYVDIFDVDTGRTETVHFSVLKVMNNEQLAKLPRQAVECRLNLDEDFALSDEVVTAFKRMAFLKFNKMVVIDVLPENVLLVDLFNYNDRCMKDKLLSKFGVVDPTMPSTSKRSASATSQKTDVENKCGHIPGNRGAEIKKQKGRDEKEIVKRVEYPKQSFKVNSTKDIYVKRVETPIRFFVRVNVEDADRSALSNRISVLNDYCVHSPMKCISDEEVVDNMAVWCLSRGRHTWKRGLVVGEPLEYRRVNVYCVDEGETRQVFSADLRLMKNGVYARLPIEAVECRLDIDADFALRTEVVEAFKYAKDHWKKMKVINVLPDHVLVVDLFDTEGHNVKDMLLSEFSVEQPTPSQASKRPKFAAFQKMSQLDLENMFHRIRRMQDEINEEQMGRDKVEVMKPVEYIKQSFKVNSSNDVSVTYVETPLKFFVKLNVNESLDTSKMYDFQRISSIEKVHDNMAVWFRFRYQFEHGYRRGLVVGEPINDKYVVVFDVDTGCTDTEHFEKLLIMNNGRYAEVPKQAVECRLDIDANFALREEVVAAFVGMAYRRLNKMKVIDVLPDNVLLVDVFDEAGQSLQDLLLRAFDVENPISPLASNTPESAAAQKAGIQ